MNKPNFFIVGAPKCGTTAMNDYLAMHPDIFMAPKEVLFFGTDLKVQSRPSKAEYLNLFRTATGEKIIGEASVWYLFSKTAAAEIKAFNPAAKILIMLRNPVDVLYSLHSQHLYDGNEDVPDFEMAIRLDVARKHGLQLPNAVDFEKLPPYIESVRFYEQVKRYFDVFGHAQVYVVLYEDFKDELETVMAETLRFLGVTATLNISYSVVNANKQLRWFWLHRLVKKPPAHIKKVVRLLLPSKKRRHVLMYYLMKKNVQVKQRTKMPDATREWIKQQVADDVHLLAGLLGKDLSYWL